MQTPEPTDILTSSGVMFDLKNPKPEDVNLTDIVNGLAQPRFNGHAFRDGGEHWTVLHHSLLVYRILRDDRDFYQYAWYALMHDAHEAYIGDIPTPVANVIDPDGHLCRVKEEVQHTIFRKFRVRPPKENLCRRIAEADLEALRIERALFLPLNRKWTVSVAGTTQAQDLRNRSDSFAASAFHQAQENSLERLPNDNRL